MTRPKIRRDRRRKSGTLTYKGRAYIRPVNRGIVLGDLERDPEPIPYLDESVERLIDGYGDCEVDITIHARRVIS